MNKASSSQGAKRAPKATKATKATKKFSTKSRKGARVVKKPVLSQPKRSGHIAVDAQNRILPVDYENLSLHDPYAYFRPETSTVFDEHPGRDFMLHNYNQKTWHAATIAQDNLLTLEIPKVRKEITDPKELEYFDKVMVPILQTRESEHIKSEEEINYELEKLGLTADRLELEEKSWGEFFTNDWKYATPAGKMRTYGAHAIMWGCAAFLAYTGFSAIDQYYYDLQYPVHGHDH